MMISFEKARPAISDPFQNIPWMEESGIAKSALQTLIEEIEETNASRAVMKAKTFEVIATHARIAVDRQDIFQDKLCAYGIMAEQRARWERKVKDTRLSREAEAAETAWEELGTYLASGDYGHVSPNTRLLLAEGFLGLLARAERAEKKEERNERQKDFYFSVRTVLLAMMTVARRLAEAVAPYNAHNARALLHIAEGAPRDIYDAMQLLVLYFFMHEYIGGTRVRTLGRLDVLLSPFYEEDLRTGRYTKAEIKEMLKFFLYKFWTAKVPFDLPFCLGGMDENGRDVTSEISYLIVEAYDELDIHSPKIHIRVSDATPRDFVLKVLSCIRHGNSSFVLINDRVGIESLCRVGICEREARDFVPIGCYEPAVWGVEMGCTGNGGINLPKAVELVLCLGKDHKSGKKCGVIQEMPTTYEAFLQAVKDEISHMTSQAVDYIVKIEKEYRHINPDPLLSAQYEHSIEKGVDVYEGGAKYNNSSLYFYSIASLVDAVAAVKRLVFEEKRFSLSLLADALRADWAGYEKERQMALRLPEKYGNGNPTADALARELSQFCASLVNGKPNGRGGVFKAALFSIDYCFHLGKRTMATPDGRHSGDPLSKNLCATVGMDRNGITALIHSVTQIDHADFSTGSVLDIMLHPTAVAGEDGLSAFYGILLTYFKKGGFAMHGNVFDAALLKEAQANPEKYKNLQVRVCGWNAYFVNLSKEEQDCFIRQAEALS